MKTLVFTAFINAPRETVWKLLFAPESYKVWTAPFSEGSYYEGSWEKGQRIRFLTPAGDGMHSIITDSRPPEFVSMKHVGMIEKGIDLPAAGKWSGALESYTLTSVDGGTEVRVELDTEPEYEQFMHDTWPKALDKLKSLCEGRE